MVDICSANGLHVAGVVDSDYYGNTDYICGIPVVGSELNFDYAQPYLYFNAVNLSPGDKEYELHNKEKHDRISNLILRYNLTCLNLIHPTAIVPKTASLGVNILIGAYAILGNNTIVEDYCQLREHSYLAHNAVLRRGTVMQVNSYVGAGIEVGIESYVAVKATVLARDVGGRLPSNTFIKSTERCIL